MSMRGQVGFIKAEETVAGEGECFAQSGETDADVKERFIRAKERGGRGDGAHARPKRTMRPGIAAVGKTPAAVWLIGILFLLCSCRVQALELKEESERPESYQLLYINEDTFLYEEADETSAVLRELKKQELVVPEEIGVPWMKVSTGGVTGYIKSAYVQTESPDSAVTREFEEQEAYHVELINEVERLSDEQKRSQIYGIIIICMIVGIFAAGIVSTVVKKKQEEGKGDVSKRVKGAE